MRAKASNGEAHSDQSTAAESKPRLRNGALTHRLVAAIPDGVATFALSRLALIGIVTGSLGPIAAVGNGTVTVDGDVDVLAHLLGVIR